MNCRIYFYIGILLFCLKPVFSHAENLLIDYPEMWGDLDSSIIDNSDCPNIKGEFLNEGEGYEVVDGNTTSSSEYGYYKPSANLLLNFRVGPENQEKNLAQKNAIYIDQNKSSLSISMPSTELRNVIDNYRFKKNTGAYECKNGWLKFHEINYKLDRESSHVNYSVIINISKLKSGSLIVYIDKRHKETSIWKLGVGEYVHTEIYAKYSPIDY